jgi:hypothetical protein
MLAAYTYDQLGFLRASAFSRSAYVHMQTRTLFVICGLPRVDCVEEAIQCSIRNGQQLVGNYPSTHQIPTVATKHCQIIAEVPSHLSRARTRAC